MFKRCLMLDQQSGHAKHDNPCMCLYVPSTDRGAKYVEPLVYKLVRLPEAATWPA